MELFNFALSTTTKMMNVVNDAGGVTTSSIIIQSSTVGGSLLGTGINVVSSTATTSNVTNINGTTTDDGCPEMERHRYPSIIGIDLAIPQWEAILVTITLTFIILLTIIGNTLVILSVFTYKPLRIVQNFFIISLAVADLTVAILVLPFNVLYIILGRWVFSIHLCKMWLTSDVLCCTSSILNLCAIALDRYWAITDPINYAQKRTLERVLYLIAGVWILSLIISSPPLIGWNDWPEVFESDTPCTLNSNPGYRIYSALGSFFIPLVIMTIVYIEIFIATRRRLRERARASRLNQNQVTNNNLTNINNSNNNNNNNNNNSKNNNNRNKKKSKLIDNNETNVSEQHDEESISSETNHTDHHHHHHNHNNANARSKEIPQNTEKSRKKDLRKKTKDSIKAAHKKYNENLLKAIVAEDSITDIPHDDDDEYDDEYDNEELIGKKCNNNNNNDCILADDKMITSFDASVCADKLDDIKFIDNINCTTTILASTINQQIPSVTTTPTTTTSHTTSSATPKQMQTSQTASAHSTVPLANTKKSNNVYQFIEEKQKISLSKERRAARTLGIIMGVFILCWVPFFLLYIIVPFCPTCCPSDLLIDFLTWLGYINSALNPIIYTIFNLEYRRAFKKLLGIKF